MTIHWQLRAQLGTRNLGKYHLKTGLNATKCFCLNGRRNFSVHLNGSLSLALPCGNPKTDQAITGTTMLQETCQFPLIASTWKEVDVWTNSSPAGWLAFNTTGCSQLNSKVLMLPLPSSVPGQNAFCSKVPGQKQTSKMEAARLRLLDPGRATKPIFCLHARVLHHTHRSLYGSGQPAKRQWWLCLSFFPGIMEESNVGTFSYFFRVLFILEATMLPQK